MLSTVRNKKESQYIEKKDFQTSFVGISPRTAALFQELGK